ncbi:MAG: CDP-glycerol--glycerophosphate glycerophosphotransferase [Erysipelothrix sp.]|nr:CDP-glycerol--glycerophosphate glycerophosphotransferase [Erysipelothrix sp.]
MSSIANALKRKIFAHKRNKKGRVRQKIKITQNKDKFNIQGTLGNLDYKVKQLQFVSRSTGHQVHINSEEESYQFSFHFDIALIKELIQTDEDIYDLFLIVRVPENNFSENRIKKLNETADVYITDDGVKHFEYPIRLGRFAETKLDNLYPITFENEHFYLYTTVEGNISLSVNYEIQPKTTTQIDFLRSKSNQIVFGGKIFTKSSKIDHINLIILARTLNVEAKMPVHTEHMADEVSKRFGLNRYRFKASVDLNDVFKNEKFNTDVYDLFFDIKYHDFQETVRVRIGKPRFRARYRTKVSKATRDKMTFAVSPYYTFKAFNLSFRIEGFKDRTYNYLKKVARWSWLLKNIYKKKDIWIIGELPYKAQDNGYHLFKYIRQRYPNKEVYYVIDKQSPDLKNIKEFGNILYYKSRKHIKYILIANKIISTHQPDFLYPLKTKKFLRKIKAKNVFIQHGVMGTKNMVANYGKQATSFNADLFLVSSEFEREMIINDFNYHPEEVAITGLARFDNLFKKDVKLQRQLLIIPTWRDWINHEDDFINSEYYTRYKELIKNPTLHNLAKEHNFEIVLCLHPNMQKFTAHFNEIPVKIINQGDIDVQTLLKQSTMMITDYSSVAFDFSFLHKPIVYYQFDRNRFIGRRGSHLDLDNDLPGDIVYDLEEVIKLTKEYAESDFKMKSEYEQRASKFLTYKDGKSSERAYQAISEKVKKRPFYEIYFESELYRALFNRFRKSKLYFPTMKRFYKIASKVLPVDDKLILFESGVGKQYADSPRNIYEEIVKRNLDYKKIWVCNKNIRFDDPNTIRIKRLSPSYYYYLAKSKFWVNNQNFPTYITKRDQTIYIQTWHGTPLKKMLHDIEKILGRSDDYLERVSNATKTWDYLVSPSPYASNRFQSAFKYKGKILETGYPRNDIFYKSEGSERGLIVKNRLKLPKDKKIILYAPTFRDNQTTKKNKFIFDMPIDLYQLKQSIGNDYIILLRMHVVISNKVKIDDELKDFAINVSNYSDIQELLLITDILITDYSSVMFDFANTKRPMLFYTYDLETYRDDVRGFYIDFEKEAPGPLIKTTTELINNIHSIEKLKDDYSDKYTIFYNKYCSLEDGYATERIVDRVFDN